jgi:hypothetical protein
MSQGDIETATIFTRAMRGIQSKFSALVSDISGKADISGQTFTGDIAAPKITASTGILFGTDTAAANTLDDYEQGAWTPVNPNWGTLTILKANYTKFGDTVRLFAQVQSDSTDSVTIDEFSTTTGLPFAVDSGSNAIGGIVQYYSSYGGAENASGEIILAGGNLASAITVVRGTFTFADCNSITINLTYKTTA